MPYILAIVDRALTPLEAHRERFRCGACNVRTWPLWHPARPDTWSQTEWAVCSACVLERAIEEAR